MVRLAVVELDEVRLAVADALEPRQRARPVLLVEQPHPLPQLVRALDRLPTDILVMAY